MSFDDGGGRYVSISSGGDYPEGEFTKEETEEQEFQPTAGAQLTSRLAGRFVTFFKLLEGATSLSAAVQAPAPAAHVVRAACPRAVVEAAR